MAKLHRPRKGSLQFYPRKRSSKFIPNVNWSPLLSKKEGLLGYIAYKVRMASALIRDKTDKSMSQNKRVAMPVTILETPPMKLFSVRFYKDGIVMKEVIVSNDKELKRKIKIPKVIPEFEKSIPKPEEYDDIRTIVYSIPSKTSIKKTPDFTELAISSQNKLEFVKKLIGKELSLEDFITPSLKHLDVRGLTKGKGYQGPVKRFGVELRPHKSEKGVRKVGSIGPWHPARITFRVPLAGQMGMFTRLHYNHKIITRGKIAEKDINPKHGFKDYGMIKTSYLVLKGSVQGPSKRQVLLTPSFRISRKQKKQEYEFQELITS